MSKATEEGLAFMRKRIVETGKPFDEIELPKMLSIVETTAKREVFNDIEDYWGDTPFVKNKPYTDLKKRHLSTYERIKIWKNKKEAFKKCLN